VLSPKTCYWFLLIVLVSVGLFGVVINDFRDLHLTRLAGAIIAQATNQGVRQAPLVLLSHGLAALHLELFSEFPRITTTFRISLQIAFAIAAFGGNGAPA
jgi:hypothetical protein